MTKIGKWAARINEKTKGDVINTIIHGRHIRVFMWHNTVDEESIEIIYGDAFCHEEDTFDINIGRAVAIAGALGLEVPRGK